MSNQNLNQYEDTISEAEAVTITTNWRNYIGQYEPADEYIRAFNIPLADIQNLAQFPGAASVRAYIAMGTEGVISSLKIILVPVTTEGKDVLSTEGQSSETVSTIFDFTSPCPQTCDLESPLFGS